MSSYCKQMYLDWLNNFATVEKFAEYYQLEEDKASEIINTGRIEHEQTTTRSKLVLR